MPFGVKSAGFNSTTLKKLRGILASGGISSSNSISRVLDIEEGCVIDHMQYLGHKKSGEKMSKAEHAKHVESLNITKRSSKARELEKGLSESEAVPSQIQAENAREASANAELAELQLADAKRGLGGITGKKETGAKAN